VSAHGDLRARSGSGSGSDLDLHPHHAAGAAACVDPIDIEAEILNSNGHRPETSKPKKVKLREDYSPAFCAFITAYPRPEYVKKASEIWKKINPDVAIVSAIMAGLACWKRSASWANRPYDKYPHPATWLNGECWKDTPPPASGLSPKTEGNIAAGHRFIESMQRGAP
jgi:hypothetical protein